MLTLRESVYVDLEKAADRRGVTIQGLIRAVIVPEWQREQPIVSQMVTELETPTRQGSQLMRDLTPYPSGAREPRNR